MSQKKKEAVDGRLHKIGIGESRIREKSKWRFGEKGGLGKTEMSTAASPGEKGALSGPTGRDAGETQLKRPDRSDSTKNLGGGPDASTTNRALASPELRGNEKSGFTRSYLRINPEDHIPERGRARESVAAGKIVNHNPPHPPTQGRNAL